MTPTELVVRATTELFGHRDLSAVERHWSPGYVEHSAAGRPGLDGLREVASGLPEGFRHDVVRLLCEGDLVVAHGCITALAPIRMSHAICGGLTGTRSSSIGTGISRGWPRTRQGGP